MEMWCKKENNCFYDIETESFETDLFSFRVSFSEGFISFLAAS